jgi:probable rRNA maturation factor
MKRTRETKANNIRISLHRTNKKFNIPSRYYFQRWINTALQKHGKNSEIAIRIVDKNESAQLNKNYRHKVGPTNILSFPFDPPQGIQLPLLGDLIICAPLVVQEAKQQHKEVLAHWAHLTIHGCLHLLGYDHIKLRDAKIMESLEVKILQQLGFKDPYL